MNPPPCSPLTRLQFPALACLHPLRTPVCLPVHLHVLPALPLPLSGPLLPIHPLSAPSSASHSQVRIRPHIRPRLAILPPPNPSSISLLPQSPSSPFFTFPSHFLTHCPSYQLTIPSPCHSCDIANSKNQDIKNEIGILPPDI